VGLLGESKELHDKVDEILSYVKSMDGQMSWLVRSQVEGMKTLLIAYFMKKKRAAKVFLAVDGKRNVNAIATYLSLHDQAVTNELSGLEEKGLVDLQKWGIYRKNKIDSILDLSKELRKEPEFQNIK
jgi:DNA-binding transcriptional ArsR family regulator